jgi:hypothetical protein
MAGVGATLASLGAGQQQEAGQVLANAADQETERNRQNKALEQQEKAGRMQLGSTLGALGGAALMASPLGSLIGGAVGAIAAGLFD